MSLLLKSDLRLAKFHLAPSCRLYLPLHELDGSSIMSRDAYGKLFIVKGATWRPNGRLFAGTDDDISTASDDWLPLGNSPRTIAIWFQTSTIGATISYLLSYGFWGTNSNYFGLHRNADKIAIAGYNETYNGTYRISINTWYLLFVSMTTTSIATFFYSPYAFIILDVNSAHTLNTLTGGKTTIGAKSLPAISNNLDGIVDRVAVWAKAITEPERQNWWEETRWRYQ